MNERAINVATIALNILDGIHHKDAFMRLQRAWEAADMGFVEFTRWIAEVADEADMLIEDKNQDFNGVFEYEVAYPLGLFIRDYMLTNQSLPPGVIWLPKLKVLINEFFSQ